MTAPAAEWLVERRKCTLDTAFSAIRAFVQCYVDASNDMQPEREKKFPYSLKDELAPRRMFVATGFPFGTARPDDRVTVNFVLNENDITVSYPQKPPARELPDLVITQKWDARKATCVLCLHGQTWTNQQVSQMAADPLFFV